MTAQDTTMVSQDTAVSIYIDTRPYKYYIGCRPEVETLVYLTQDPALGHTFKSRRTPEADT